MLQIFLILTEFETLKFSYQNETLSIFHTLLTQFCNKSENFQLTFSKLYKEKFIKIIRRGWRMEEGGGRREKGEGGGRKEEGGESLYK